jgi:ketosteroid isomerase-like protein
MKEVFSSILLACLLSSCGQSPPERGQTRTHQAPAAATTLRAASASLQKAIGSRDLDKIMAFYADDATLAVSGSPLVQGKQAIRRKWQDALSHSPPGETESSSGLEVYASADMGYTVAVDTSPVSAAARRASGLSQQWLSVWKRQADGAWRIIEELHGSHIKRPPIPLT